MMRKAVDAANPGPDPSKETWLSEQRLRQLHTLKQPGTLSRETTWDTASHQDPEPFPGLTTNPA